MNKKGAFLAMVLTAAVPGIMNMAVSAMNRNKLVGLYMNKIHTPRDTVFDETNIEFLCSGTIRMLDSVL